MRNCHFLAEISSSFLPLPASAEQTQRAEAPLGGRLSWEGTPGGNLRSECNNIVAARLSFDKNQRPRDEARRIAAKVAKLLETET
jgi:hypothetical protein